MDGSRHKAMWAVHVAIMGDDRLAKGAEVQKVDGNRKRGRRVGEEWRTREVKGTGDC